MNVINVKIDFTKGTCEKTGISLITGDYNTTKVVFEFDESADNKTKMFEMKNPNDELVYVDEILNNEVILVGIDENQEIYSLFTQEGDYIFEVSLYGTDSKLTSVCGYITANKEQVIVDGEIVEEKITLFDNLMNTLDEKIQEANNLDIDGEKIDNTTTITITKKDGTTKELEILDGQDGEKGDKGDKGDAGAIKMQIVNELPQIGDEDTIYLVPLEEPESEENRYSEYVWISNQWELLGKIGIEADLTNYYTKNELNTLLNNKLDTTKVKTTISTTSGDVYDVTYINSIIGDISSALDTINNEVI